MGSIQLLDLLGWCGPRGFPSLWLHIGKTRRAWLLGQRSRHLCRGHIPFRHVGLPNSSHPVDLVVGPARYVLHVVRSLAFPQTDKLPSCLL